MTDRVYLKPSDGPCDAHGWPTSGLGKRLFDALRASPIAGINVCRGCLERARDDSERRVRRKMRQRRR